MARREEDEAGTGGVTAPARVRFLGADFDLASKDEVLARLGRRRRGDPFAYVVTPNVDHVIQIDRDPTLRPLYDGAWMVWNDSHPIRRLARWFELDLPHLNGTDVMERLFAEVLAPGDRLAVIAASHELAAALPVKFPAYDWAIHVAGAVDRDDAAREAAIAFAAGANARFLFIGIGCPRSERIAAEIARRPGATGAAFCVGAALEFIAGVKPRAPEAFRRLELEWLHRLLAEPRRLWRRYVGAVAPLARLVHREVEARRSGAFAATPTARPVSWERPGAVRVLHVTADYPDPVREPTTEAVAALLDRTADLHHVVFSLKRVGDPRRTWQVDCGLFRGRPTLSIGYFQLPFGIGLHRAFLRVADRVEDECRRRGFRPDVIHAHRLAFDGVAGWILARRFGVPLVVSVRGETESKIFRFKPTYRPLLARIATEAAQLYYVSAWFRAPLVRYTGVSPDKGRALPNIVANARSAPAAAAPDRRIATILNLEIWRKKGLDRLLRAFAQVAPRLPGVILDVYGKGDAAPARRFAERLGLADRVIFHGAVDHGDLLKRLPGVAVMALPSFNETFGMVYVESLFAGVPILYAKGTGVDGHLDGLDVGIGVPPSDVAAIGEALVRLLDDNDAYRSRIAAARDEIARRFDPDVIAAAYRRDILELGSAAWDGSASSQVARERIVT